jgi:triosephosphate isomerase (TIM)
MKPLVAGNWKMNGTQAGLSELALIKAGAPKGVDLLVCPPFHLLASFSAADVLDIGAQDCHALPSGAYTGNISAEMVRDTGAKFVIVGHSERRQYHHESDVDVSLKASAAWRAGLTAIICVGETRDERVAGEALTIIGEQLEGSVPDGATAANTVIAYEPVWAIGTGLVPSVADVTEMHEFMRNALAKRFGQEFRLLYGGSVKPNNAKELMSLPNVNGALVGGASLKASDFLGILGAYA